jgi:hypothetical protein
MSEITGGTKKLIEILNKALPHVRDTGVTNHLSNVRSDPNGHGKVVLFNWQQRDFRLTSNLIVQEYQFGFVAYTMRKSNEMTHELMTRINNVVNPPVIEAEKVVKAVEPIETIAPVETETIEA